MIWKYHYLSQFHRHNFPGSFKGHVSNHIQERQITHALLSISSSFTIPPCQRQFSSLNKKTTVAESGVTCL
jgi:hypothetical protein